MSYTDSEKDQMMALDTLAAYHVQQARSEKNREKRKDFFAQVSIHICIMNESKGSLGISVHLYTCIQDSLHLASLDCIFCTRCVTLFQW